MTNFWANVKSNAFHDKLLWSTFWATFENFGLLFDSASDHSVQEPNFKAHSYYPDAENCRSGAFSVKLIYKITVHLE